MGKYVKCLRINPGQDGSLVAGVGRRWLWMKFEINSVDSYFSLAGSRHFCQKCSNEMKTCKTCHNFQWCLSLCKGAAYASQDEVNQKELLIGIPRYSPPFPFKPSPISLTKAERITGELLVNNLGRQDASQLLGISTKTLHNRISQMKHKYYNEADFLP